MPRSVSAKDFGFEGMPCLKICITGGLSKKEIEKAGITIRHAITKIMRSKKP